MRLEDNGGMSQRDVSSSVPLAIKVLSKLLLTNTCLTRRCSVLKEDTITLYVEAIL